MDIALRRMRAEDIPQVIEIEQEAFSPGWVGTPFRRELNRPLHAIPGGIPP